MAFVIKYLIFTFLSFAFLNLLCTNRIKNMVLLYSSYFVLTGLIFIS